MKFCPFISKCPFCGVSMLSDALLNPYTYFAPFFFRSVPKTLSPLLPWLSEDIPQLCTGVDATQCLIFLPSLTANIQNCMDLPVVPAAQHHDEELNYIEKIPPKLSFVSPHYLS